MIEDALVLEAGFCIHFTTWENDADDYRTQTVSGLTAEDVHFYLSLAQVFRSDGQHRDLEKLDNLGNEEIDSERLIKVIQQKLEDHLNISEVTKDIWTEVVNSKKDVHEAMYKILGDPVQYEWEFCRVYESHKIYYIDEIRIYPNLSASFE